MPTKGRQKLDTTMESTIAPAPSLSTRYPREMQGVDPIINKPADEGKIHMRTFCGDMRSLGVSQVERMDSTLKDGNLDVRYQPGGDSRPKASENLDSTFEVSMKGGGS